MFEAGAALPTALRDQLDAGRLMIPLSSVTCEELTEIPRDQFREPMADVMWRLSKDATIARRPRSWTRSTGGRSADFSGERAGVRPRVGFAFGTGSQPGSRTSPKAACGSERTLEHGARA